MKNTLSFKNPLPGQPGITYDLTEIIEAQGRVSEIAHANPHRAPELLSKFVAASFALSDILGDLQFQVFLAERKTDERKALLQVDLIPEVVKERKLGSNAETRQALVDLDTEYQEAMIVLGSLQAGLELVKQKLRAMDSAASATKKIMDDTLLVYRRGGNPNLGQAYKPELDYDNTTAGLGIEVATSEGSLAIGAASYGAKNGKKG